MNMGPFTQKALAYSMCVMIAGTAVSSIVHALGLDDKPLGKSIVSVSLDLVGLAKGVWGLCGGGK